MRFSCIVLAALSFFSGAAAMGQQPQALTLNGDYPMTHDPAIAREGSQYYVYATGHAPQGGEFAIRCSSDLTSWKLCGQVFDQIPEWIRKTSPQTKELWAPDVSYFNGKFHLYYAFSAFGLNTSGIALLTNATLDPSSPNYRWQDEGLVLQSVQSDNFNAIDPNIVLDEKGQPWLSFGSFWSGIKMRRIDAATGKLSPADTTTYAVAGRARPAGAAPGGPADWQAIEAPFVIHHGRYYYLFVSFDLCCRGLQSTYRMVVGRSRTVTGPYLDANNQPMIEGGGTPLLSGNRRWIGPGGQSVLQQKPRDLIVFHAYDAVTGKPALQISTLTWRHGWPQAALSLTGEAK